MPVATGERQFGIGYLAGLVDGEGYVFVHYARKEDRTYPDLRIYCTSKPIIEGACRIMSVNPHPRRDHGKLVGWIAAAQGKRAIGTLRKIAPHLADSSKKCRAIAILKIFGAGASIAGRHPSSELFSHCPSPARLHAQQAQPASNPVELREGVLSTEEHRASRDSRSFQAPASGIPLEASDVRRGWLCGLVDGEGYIRIRYRGDRDAMYPRLRIFVKSRSIIDTAAGLMGVNPYSRRSHGKPLGWYASVSHLKALKVLRLIAPHLLETSKRYRARKILDSFGNIGTLHSRIMTSEFFAGCPPLARMRASKG
jgi:hypothetical protein